MCEKGKLWSQNRVTEHNIYTVQIKLTVSLGTFYQLLFITLAQ